MGRVFATLMVLVLALPAYAQTQKMTLPKLGKNEALSPEEQEKRRATERAYLEKLKTIPDQKPPADPWKTVR